MENLSETDAQSLFRKVEDTYKKLNEFEAEINLIKERNARVEQDKKWETSLTRFICVLVITYITMNLILWTIGDPSHAINAVVPTTGYILSTLSLNKIKELWKSKSS